jgi:uncharacterized protein YfkK (UPF0435 family)
MIHSTTQETKLKIIEQLIIMNDDAVFKQIEDLISKSLHRPKHSKFSPKELINRAQLASTDIDENRLFSQNEAEKIAQNW